MTALSITDRYDSLCSQFNNETAKNVATFIETKTKDELNNKTQIFATKEDLFKTESRLEQAISRIDVKISDTKVDLIRWILAFWITIVLMFVGLYFKN